MEKFFSGETGYLLTLVGLVLAVVLGVMSILLPLVVFRIMTRVAAINHKMDTIISLLAHRGAEVKSASPQRPSPDPGHFAAVLLKGPAVAHQGPSLRDK